MPKHTSKPINKLQNFGIILSGKEHSLLTTNDYILKEYADVFNGIRTLPGPPYHIQLKEDFEPVQHVPHTVPVVMQQAYQAELQRLLCEGVIAEVHGYTEWVNSITPVQNPNGEIRLCLDPRDLNKVIKRNAWYMRTLDDILQQLSLAKTISMADVMSRHWHVILHLQSSLLTTFSTPCGKFRWLRLPFGLKILSDVLHERLNRVLRLVPGIVGIADDIITQGQSEVQCNASFLTLCKTAKINGLKLNKTKLQFKYTD